MGLIALTAAVVLEASVTTLPLTFLILLFVVVATRRNEAFFLAFLTGFILDVLTMRMIGLSSIYFVIFVCIVFLYQKKFEIDTLPFITGFSFIGSLGYLVMTGSRGFILQALLVTIISALSFLVFKILNKKLVKIV